MKKGKKMEPTPMIVNTDGRYPTPQEYARMFEQIAPTRPVKSPGRKKKFGTLDTSYNGHVRWFTGYCEYGHKSYATREEMDQLKINVRKCRRSLRFKLFKFLYEHWS